jgi:multiple sugar transport system substrate-binding protein
MKRILSMVLTLSFVLSVLGGSLVFGAAKAPDAKLSYKGTITVWDGPRWADKKQNQYYWLEAKKAEFEKKHPGVKIEIVKTPWEEMSQKLNIAVAGRAWPDITSVDLGKGGVDRNLVAQGVIEPLDSYFTKAEISDFYPNALNAYKANGKLYGIPNSMSVHALLLNLDIFKAKGVTPPRNGKWTYDEFVTKMKALTDSKVSGFSTYILPGYYESWPFLLMDGGYPLSSDNKKYTFDSPEAISGLQKLLDLKFKYKVAPKDMGGADVGGTWKAWASSQQRTVAVEPWATWAVASAQSAKWKTNFMVAEYPTGKLGKSVTISGVGGFVMFKQTDAAKRKMTAEFMKYITNTTEQFVTAQNYGVFPARISTVELHPYAKNVQMAQAQALTKNAIMLPITASWTRVDEAIQRQLQLAANGEKTATQALKDARSEVESILNN